MDNYEEMSKQASKAREGSVARDLWPSLRAIHAQARRWGPGCWAVGESKARRLYIIGGSPAKDRNDDAWCFYSRTPVVVNKRWYPHRPNSLETGHVFGATETIRCPVRALNAEH